MPDTPKTDSKKRMTVKEARMQKEKIKENRNYKIVFTVLGCVGLLAGLLAMASQKSLFAFLFFFILVFYGMGMFLWMIRDGERIEELDSVINRGKSVPEELKNFGKKYVGAAEKIFEKAGFTNVKCIPLKDLNKWQLKKEGCVASITVDSVNALFCEDKYDSDVEVVISYHSPK